MRITVDLDEQLLQQTMTLTGEKKKSPAVSKAVEDFVRRAKAREFGQLIRESAFDYGDNPSSEEGILNPVPPLDNEISIGKS